MKYNFKTERGQAIVFIALAIVGLVGFTALAIDGGNAFSDRRHAQNAADTAAFSAALAKIRENDNWDQRGLDLATANGYNNDHITNKVLIHTCDKDPFCSFPYDGNDASIDPAEYIHVIITSYVNTFFAPVVGVEQVTNRVEAITHAKLATEMFYGNAVVSVCPSGETFRIGGDIDTEVIDGGVFVNSDDDCAFVFNGAAGDISVPSISIAGNVCDNSKPVVDEYGNPPTEGVPQMPPSEYDYSWLDNLIDCENATTDYTLEPIEGKTKSLRLIPGGSPVRIDESFPIKETGSVVTEIDPGIYCLYDDFTYTSSAAGSYLKGTDVTFVMMTEGHQGLTINGINVELSAPETGPTADLLFYQPVNFTNPLNIAGNATLLLTGSIIAPGAEINFKGSSETVMAGQMIGCEIVIQGGSQGVVKYDDEEAIDDPPKIEMTN